MKILLIADKIAPSLYENFNKGLFKDVHMVVSCGDLPPYYLEFIVSTLNVPCFYVPGNHDTCFTKESPPGWVSLDGRVVKHKGLSMLGFGGSMRYNMGPFQYSEFEMKIRYLKALPGLWGNMNKLDIFVTHAAAYQLGDIKTIPHKGFRVFREIIDTFKPRYHFHGHVHLNYSTHDRVIQYKETEVINGYQYYLLDYL